MRAQRCCWRTSSPSCVNCCSKNAFHPKRSSEGTSDLSFVLPMNCWEERGTGPASRRVRFLGGRSRGSLDREGGPVPGTFVGSMHQDRPSFLLVVILHGLRRSEIHGDYGFQR